VGEPSWRCLVETVRCLRATGNAQTICGHTDRVGVSHLRVCLVKSNFSWIEICLIYIGLNVLEYCFYFFLFDRCTADFSSPLALDFFYPCPCGERQFMFDCSVGQSIQSILGHNIFQMQCHSIQCISIRFNAFFGNHFPGGTSSVFSSVDSVFPSLFWFQCGILSYYIVNHYIVAKF